MARAAGFDAPNLVFDVPNPASDVPNLVFDVPNSVSDVSDLAAGTPRGPLSAPDHRPDLEHAG